MQREVIEVPGISEVSRAHGVPISAAVRANGMIFVSGTPPIDPAQGAFVRDSIAAQTERCLRNLKHVLETAGSSLENVLKCNIYCTSVDLFPDVNDVYRRYFPKDYPARIFISVPAWNGGFDIEIDCIAAVDD